MKRCWICLLFLMAPALSWAYDWGTNPGDGSAENPYQVSEPNHLIALGDNTAISMGEHYFIFTNDIVFDPDNDSNHLFAEAVIKSFNGILDGRGHVVENLTIISEAEKMSHVGLLGTLEETGVIQNTGLVNVVILMPGLETPSDFIGAICGENNGLIQRCMVIGLVRGTIIIGAIAGANWGSIYDCYAAGLVEGFSTIGGICGYNGGPGDRMGVIRRCCGSVEIDTTGFTNGALVGQYFGGELAECAWDSDIAQVTAAYSLNSGSNGQGIEHVYKYTTDKMMQKQNFGFLDFAGDLADGEKEIWRMCTNGITAPKLSWEFDTQGDFACPDGTALEDFGMLSSCFLATMNIEAELSDDKDQTVNLNELARLGAYWMQTECGCAGADITGDGMVDADDLGEVIDAWLITERPECVIADMNRDGAINLLDFVWFTDFWLDE